MKYIRDFKKFKENKKNDHEFRHVIRLSTQRLSELARPIIKDGREIDERQLATLESEANSGALLRYLPYEKGSPGNLFFLLWWMDPNAVEVAGGEVIDLIHASVAAQMKFIMRRGRRKNKM